MILEGYEPGQHGFRTGQKVLGEGVVRHRDLFQALETSVGRGTGQDRFAPDGNLVVLGGISLYIVDKPLVKIDERHKGFL